MREKLMKMFPFHEILLAISSMILISTGSNGDDNNSYNECKRIDEISLSPLNRESRGAKGFSRVLTAGSICRFTG